MCVLFGRIIRSIKKMQNGYRFTYIGDEAGSQHADIVEALKQLNVLDYSMFKTRQHWAVSIKDPVFMDWI